MMTWSGISRVKALVEIERQASPLPGGRRG
jgi:hypothetical protein